MKKYRVLSLTDHSKHTKENSIYAILSNWAKHERCSEIFVASRGIKENEAFFNSKDLSRVTASRVEDDFSFDSRGKHFTRNCEEVLLSDFDIIFLRLPRPVSDSFLEGLKEQNGATIFVNDPIGIIECGSKEFLLNFPSLCPPIKLCKSKEEILSFCKDQENGTIVLKPLKEYGGRGITKIKGNIADDGKSIYQLSTYLKKIESELSESGLLAMKYLKNVTEGDKRLIVVGGTILAASLRMPPPNSWLCNVALGGHSVASKPTARELKIVEEINPLLAKNGILIYGVDTLMNDAGERVLSEINTLSIGGFPQAEKQSGRPIIKLTIDKILKYADERIN